MPVINHAASLSSFATTFKCQNLAKYYCRYMRLYKPVTFDSMMCLCGCVTGSYLLRNGIALVSTMYDGEETVPQVPRVQVVTAEIRNITLLSQHQRFH